MDHTAQQRARQNQRLLENLATAVVLLDDHLCVSYANPAAEQLFATSLAHLLGQALQNFFQAESWNLADVQDLLENPHTHTRREARLQFPYNEHVGLVDYTITPLADGDGSPHQLLLELQPLDRRLRILHEDSLLTANQATRALAHGLAHEIKNPLGGIRGAAQLLERSLDAAELREYTAVIINEVDRLRQLVDRMLGPRLPPARRWINIHQVLERVRRILQAETGTRLTLVRDYDPSLPELWADPDQLIQVVLNLLRNAAQSLLENLASLPAPPRIILRSRALSQYTIGPQRHRLVCLLEIEDNGPGVNEDLRQTLFYPMVTGRSQGTGLGLPIAQNIMQQHGGLIECHSRPGQTVFRILIPFLDPQATAAHAAHTAHATTRLKQTAKACLKR